MRCWCLARQDSSTSVDIRQLHVQLMSSLHHSATGSDRPQGATSAATLLHCCCALAEPVVQADLHQGGYCTCCRPPGHVYKGDEPRPAADQSTVCQVHSAVQQQPHDGTLRQQTTCVGVGWQRQEDDQQQQLQLVCLVGREGVWVCLLGRHTAASKHANMREVSSV